MTIDITRLKHDQMKLLAQYRRKLYKNPILKFLFLELTLRCNERCLHCGSLCGDVPSNELTFEQYRKILDDIAADFDIRSFQLCITGGEPLLRSDFFDIMGYANDLGYNWGMTSNGTLIDAEKARRLKECGMKTISVSIDGMKDSHDAFRRTPGGYDRAMRGIQCLIDAGGFKEIQVTTVINHSNMDELDELYDIFCKMDIDSWRVIGIEPMGRALDHPDLLLTGADQRRLFEFIREKRMEDMPVTYGCSHFLGYKYEREVRDHYFLCNSGVYTASILCNGDIVGCLDVERIPETIQGNILTDRFKDVWENRFQFFRRDISELCTQSQIPDATGNSDNTNTGYETEGSSSTYVNIEAEGSGQVNGDIDAEGSCPANGSIDAVSSCSASGNIDAEGYDLAHGNCAKCRVREFCAGGAMHSFDFAAGRQRVCFLNTEVFGPDGL